MPTDKPNTIKVSETREYEIPADRADLLVMVEGTSLVTGQEALHKAREVAQLVQGLTEYGLSPENIYLQGVYADTSSWALGKTSHVRYRLRIRCTQLAMLADMIGIITVQKNAALNLIEWGYPDDDAQKDQWLQECIARVNAKASLIAAGLGVRLVGVHAFSEKYLDGETPGRTAVTMDAMLMARTRAKPMTGEDLGLEISHTKTVQVSVEAEYLVSGYGTISSEAAEISPHLRLA